MPTPCDVALSDSPAPPVPEGRRAHAAAAAPRSALRSSSETHSAGPGSPSSDTTRSAAVKSSRPVYVDLVTRHAMPAALAA
eukprot:scaffold6016_cov119-Isochrysis_galbana.AAC.2